MKSIYQINGITLFNRKKRIFIVIILAFLLVHTAIRRETNLSIILNILLRLLVLVSESYDNEDIRILHHTNLDLSMDFKRLRFCILMNFSTKECLG